MPDELELWKRLSAQCTVAHCCPMNEKRETFCTLHNAHCNTLSLGTIIGILDEMVMSLYFGWHDPTLFFFIQSHLVFGYVEWDVLDGAPMSVSNRLG